MSGPVTYRRDESVAVITMDDGKVNALGVKCLCILRKAETLEPSCDIHSALS